MPKPHFLLLTTVVLAVFLIGPPLAAQQIVITEIDPEEGSTGETKSQPVPTVENPSSQIPAGLFDQDPMVRLLAVQKGEKERTLQAENKLASMVQSDPFPEVRRAACQTLATLGAMAQMGVLKTVAANDSSSVVRSAAANAVTSLESRPKYTTKSALLAASEPGAGDGGQGTPGDGKDKYKKPELTMDDEGLHTRHFGFGLGTMGGYGVAALDARFRIATPSQYLPWIGIEVGGGWTPPDIYAVIAGPVGDVTNDDNKWKIISGAAAVLFYLHRLHYIPLRGGVDMGQGPYAMLGYGFEQLNPEGFFSWGVEVGILIHPVIEDWRDNLVDCDNGDGSCNDVDLWPVIPYVRFVLHFYLV
jgi:hypothetical protein